MVRSRKKIDNRIRVLIENGVHRGHRTLFVLVGDKGRDQVVILHYMLSKSAVKARPNLLWCYEKELGFSSHRKKRMRQLQNKIRSGKVDVDEDDPFEVFIASTTIRYCYYKETHKILGNTFGMCVLQDFESLTPNLLAQTIETVEGGGIIVLLLRTMNSLKQFYTLNMEVHKRYRTEQHQHIVGRFNERFMLSLGSCENCIVMDDSLNVLPISHAVGNISPMDISMGTETKEDSELKDLKASLQDTQPVGVLINCCKTLDQAKAVLKFVDAISEKSLNATVSLTAARGRGKSAALGLSIAAAVAFGYSNIYVTSPSPENLKTLFEFVFKGFEVLEYQEHTDYERIESSDPEFNKAIVRVSFFRDHRQTIQYIRPTEASKLGQAELLVIDEAAAIPLPLVKSLFGPYLMFLASTINGYEGTGRSLSLKLLQQLRTQNSGGKTNSDLDESKVVSKVSGRVLSEVTLEESIRYKSGDPIENWLTKLLCLDATLTQPLISGCPAPANCELYYISRDTLFSYHKGSELFLHRIMSLYVASHYKNSPNDLQMLSDAPAHHLFCLLGPVDDPNKTAIPEVYAVIQVCLEGKISESSLKSNLRHGKNPSGDLIPWTLAQQFQDSDFPSLSGARIVRIATHPDYQGMGYGSRALKILQEYYELKYVNLSNEVKEARSGGDEIESVPDGELSLLEEQIAPRNNLPPLLLELKERPAEPLHYLGVSYGITHPLLKFWNRAGFIPVYLRQTANDLTGEHSCIMLKLLNNDLAQGTDSSWLKEFWSDFRRRFVSLLSYQFRVFPPGLAYSLLQNNNQTLGAASDLTLTELDVHLTPHDMERIKLYKNNMADYHLITDLLPTLSKLFFLNKMGSMSLTSVQKATILGMGLQSKTVDDVARDLGLPAAQLLGLFNRTIMKMYDYLNGIKEKGLSKELDKVVQGSVAAKMVPMAESLAAELNAGADELKKKQEKELAQLKKTDLSQYVIKGSEETWEQVLEGSTLGSKVISIKTGEKRLNTQPAAKDDEKKAKRGRGANKNFKGLKGKKKGGN